MHHATDTQELKQTEPESTRRPANENPEDPPDTKLTDELREREHSDMTERAHRVADELRRLSYERGKVSGIGYEEKLSIGALLLDALSPYDTDPEGVAYGIVKGVIDDLEMLRTADVGAMIDGAFASVVDRMRQRLVAAMAIEGHSTLARNVAKPEETAGTYEAGAS
jgi:hypothetical protein